jgi:hypothetical protein
MLTELFNRKFNCAINELNLRSICRYYGLERIIPYTPEEKRFLENNVSEHSYAELTDMFNRKFKCSKTVSQINYFCIKVRQKNKRKTKPIGSEHVDCYGRWYIKTAQPNVWKQKHRVVWEAANGPVPQGHSVIFADGDRSNFDLDNLLLVSNKTLMIMARRKLLFPDKEATKTGKQIADLMLLINRKKREAEQGGAAIIEMQKMGGIR